MIRSKAFAAVLAFALAGSASAQPTPVRPGTGAPVRDSSGAALGTIESVTTDNAGRPVQVVVRSRGVGGVRARSRAVPVESLRPEGSGWVIPLRRAEFELLPPVRR